jgi:transcriptional regulator of NAD metabolism
MTIWWLILILTALVSGGTGFIWLALHIGSGGPKNGKSQAESLEEAADQDVEHVFNEDFREELRNRGRLHFEKIIGENAMFLQQDLRLTTSQLNEYMKTEITHKLQEEFNKYEQSIMDAKQLAIESIQKTNTAIDEQRQIMSEQVQQEILAEKKQILTRFESNMTDIVNHYVLAAIGDQIDLSDQLEYILADLEANKKAILEDIQSGA